MCHRLARLDDAARDLRRRGIIELNRAVSLEPANVGPMLVRGSVYISASRTPSMAVDLRTMMLALGTYDYERVYDLQKEQGYFQLLAEHARGRVQLSDLKSRTCVGCHKAN